MQIVLQLYGVKNKPIDFIVISYVLIAICFGIRCDRYFLFAEIILGMLSAVYLETVGHAE